MSTGVDNRQESIIFQKPITVDRSRESTGVDNFSKTKDRSTGVDNYFKTLILG